MADNFPLTPGSGRSAATDQVTHSGDTADVQLVRPVLTTGAEGSKTVVELTGDNTNGLDVDVTRVGGDVTVVQPMAANLNVRVENVTGTVSLPTGAATAAKQPALGTAGTASADVITVQGVASMTPVQVSDAGGSLTVDAPVGTPAFVRLSDGSAPITTLPVSLASVPSHAVTNAGTFAVQNTAAIPAGSNAIGTVTAVGAAAEDAAATGNPVLIGGRYDSSSRTLETGDAGAIALNASGHVLVEISAGASSGGTSAADGATFTRNTTSITPVGAVVETSAPTLTNGDVAGLSQDGSGNLRVRVEAGGVAGIAEDTASAGGEEGIAILAVRRDVASSGVSADGDFTFLSTTSDGSLRVSGSSGTAQYAEDAAHASGDSLCMAGAVRRDTPAVGSGTDGDNSTLNVSSTGRLWTSATVDAALPAGTNNIGDVDVLTVPTDPFGANADAASATGSISAKLRFIAATGIPVTSIAAGDNNIGNVDVVTLPNVTLAAGTNTNEVVGDAAHGAAAAGNPLLTGLEGRSTAPTAVDDGDVVRALATLLGKQVVVPYALPANSESYASPAAVTDTADDAAFAAGGAGIRHYITGVQVFNGHDTVGTEVVIKDGSTVLWRGWAEQTGGGCSARFDPPLRGTAATAVNVANITTGSATYFNLQGYQSAE